MSSIVKKLNKAGLFTPKEEFVTDTVYEVLMGSVAYGVSNDTSDVDVYAVTVPPKTMVFPHLTGHIHGFGSAPKNFEVYQKHHMQKDEKEYDVAVYSLIKYFDLCAQNNPNMLDSLFVPDRCVLHMTDVGQHMRSHRKMFLSKQVFNKLRGYAFGELKKLSTYKPEANAKRTKSFEKFGYDVKSGYHVVRLMREAEQILQEGDLDLELSREQLKAVRRGEWTLEQLTEWFHAKEKTLDLLSTQSSLPVKADYGKLRTLITECLEIHYGSLDFALNTDPGLVEKFKRIKKIVEE
jgi:predicted nucleotidyltransferase